MDFSTITGAALGGVLGSMAPGVGTVGGAVVGAVGGTAASAVGSGVATIGQSNVKNFSAKEIQRQSDRLKEQSVVFLAKVAGAKNICEDIADTVKSEDSNLAGSWKKLAENFGIIKSKYEKALNLMIERMNTYAAKSIVNEEIIERGANAIGNALDEVASFLQNLDL